LLIIIMSLYGYDQSIMEGDSMTARNREFNQGVRLHNKAVMDNYDKALKTQKTTVDNLKDKKRNDAILNDSEDGYGVIGAAVSVLGARKEYKQARSFGDYYRTARDERMKVLKGGFDDIKQTAKGPADVGAATGDGGGAGTAREAFSRPAPRSAPGARPSLLPTEQVQAEEPTPNLREAMSRPPVTSVAPEVEGDFKYEGSGVGAKVIKAGLSKIGVADTIGEGATGLISESAGKVAGLVAGGTDLVEGVDNLVEGKGFFAQDGNDTAKKVGDSFVTAGAVLDAIGTVAPPLEVLGGLAGITGGIINTVDDWFGDKKKIKDAGKKIDKPTTENSQLEQKRVSPAFQSLGLVASAPTSVKSQIQGSGSF
jgi:hypothetical protein